MNPGKICDMVFEFCIWIFMLNIIIVCHAIMDQITQPILMKFICFKNDPGKPV